MRTEKEKMLAGELYNALDPELTQERIHMRLLLKALNEGPKDDPVRRGRVFRR